MAIAAACARFRPDWDGLRAGMAADGVVGPAFVAALRTLRSTSRTVPFLHWHATSQDVVDTGLVLRLKAVAAELDGRLQALIATLGKLSARRKAASP